MNRDDSDKSKILVIECGQLKSTIVLKDYKRKKKRFQYIFGSPCLTEPIFLENELILDEEVIINDSSNLLILDDCYAKSIILPFQYKDVFLKRAINDTTITIEFNKHIKNINPGDSYVDSIVSIEHQGKRVIQSTTYYFIKNYGLKYRKNIKSYNQHLKDEQRVRDSIERKEIESKESN